MVYLKKINKNNIKYGVGEGWKRSVGLIMWEMKK
jgi:hypothetical protein